MRMNKYITLFKLYFVKEMQFRAAVFFGVITQFLWAILNILAYKAFYESALGNFPMSFQSLVNYIWFQQAFMFLFTNWYWEYDLFMSIKNGNVILEMLKPINIYHIWFARSLYSRVLKAILRSIPILIFAIIVPPPFRLSLAIDGFSFLMFLVSLILSLCMVVSIGMLVYMIAFFVIEDRAIRTVFSSIAQFLSGAIIPLAFFPTKVYGLVRWLPFSITQDIAFRIYGGDIIGVDIFVNIGIQLLYCIALILLGRATMHRAILKLEMQGG